MTCKKVEIVLIIALIFVSIAWTLGFLREYTYAPYLIHLENAASAQNIVPVAIIGSGPAGLSAAIYTARARLKTVVFTGKQLGGQLAEASYVENWPGMPKLAGIELMSQVKAQAERFGAQVVSQSVVQVDCSRWPFVLVLEDGTIIKALSIIVATGGDQKLLPVPGVQEYWGKGVGVCTICDAPFDKNKDVVVVGGGDSAIDKALQLAAFARTVMILVKNKSLHAASIGKEYIAQMKNISVRYNTEITAIKGDGSRVNGIDIIDVVTHKTETLPVQSVYFALGFQPNTKLFGHMLQLQNGYIKTHNGRKTSQPGVFAAGNVEDCLYQKAGAAAGMGVCAGLDAIEFLQSIGFTAALDAQFKDRYYNPRQIEATASKLRLVSDEKALQKLFSSSQDLQFVEVFSSMCPSCKQARPWIEEITYDLSRAAKKYSVSAVDRDKVPSAIERFGLERIPAIVAMRKGTVIERHDIEDRKKLLDFIASVTARA